MVILLTYKRPSGEYYRIRMPQIVLVLAIILYGGAVIVGNLKPQKPREPSVFPSPTVTVTQETPTPATSGKPVPSPTVRVRNVTATPTKAVPTATPKVIPLATATPKPATDTQPPVIDQVTGPADGSTVNFNSFCFPVHVTDNVPSGITIRYSFNSGPGEWGTDYAPCFQNVREGWHTFVVQAKDAAGNVSGYVSRYFQVVLAKPTAAQTPAPTSVPSE